MYTLIFGVDTNFIDIFELHLILIRSRKAAAELKPRLQIQITITYCKHLLLVFIGQWKHFTPLMKEGEG